MSIRVALVTLFALGSVTLPGQEPTPPTLSGKLETVNGLSVLSLWGTPRERGFAHGWLLAEEILEMMREGLKPLVGQNGKLLAPLLASGFTFSDDEIAEMEGLRDGIEKRLPGRKVPVLDKPLTVDEIKLINTYGGWYTLGCF